ncbi:2,3-bisphosphoglycerate-independent phosphoglycerate mutase [Nematocida minor]|uniref:2,3-bisphosphoglycerate-independent phosphoglycerate mutase n=1 Tax=Nematocida minor TaxID=1912983 RepID=UPI002220757F|nr:2,3-bisphosphoglycerate-independent phosphoglycerate mutase [Nematocida minor]KAI5189656.1 2,3-bisphosphoglycerate-independent phosphoglycerate mutase [Nematocida minor]
MQKKCCLVVLDGWGCNETKNEEIVDGISAAGALFIDGLIKRYSSYLLYAHGTHVGLSSDELMGNSEVGHLTIGAGRVVLQDSVRIRKTLESGAEEIAHRLFRQHRKSVHILGILSDGGIHGHWHDIRDMAVMASKSTDRVYIHTISDGRDTRPSEYLKYFDALVSDLPENVWVASVAGRFYSMDRDKREERTEEAYNEIVCSEERRSTDASLDKEECNSRIREHIDKSYREGITDEFIRPFCITGRICKNDTVIITNFRVDRIKQIHAKLKGHAEVYSMTRVCNEQENSRVLFVRPEIENTLGDVIEESGLSQVRIAETEKQAHVTFFFDGGKDRTREKESRIIHPSKKVETHDLAPEMQAERIAESVCEEMKEGTDFILANFANCDMVGHTGSLDATVKAVREVDKQIEKIFKTAKECRYSLVITADHGNAEIMADGKGVVKSHSTNRVPAVVIAEEAVGSEKGDSGTAAHTPNEEGTLASIAPTVLELLGLPVPGEMTGVSLVKNRANEK